MTMAALPRLSQLLLAALLSIQCIAFPQLNSVGTHSLHTTISVARPLVLSTLSAAPQATDEAKKGASSRAVNQQNSILSQQQLLEQADEINRNFSDWNPGSNAADKDLATTMDTDITSPGENDGAVGGLFWRGVVVLLCALWASNFPVAKLIMAEPGVDSSLYAVTRFGVAALALLPGAVVSSKKHGMDWETFKGSVLCGSFVAFGYLGQTLGLLSTTASKSCVICSLHCVFVAIVAEAMRVRKANESVEAMTTATTDSNLKFDFKRLVPAAVAVAGVAVVELQGGAGGPNIGDALSFAQPIGFGLGYLTLEELMAKRPETAVTVSFIKLAIVAMASLAMFELTPLIQNGADAWTLSVPDFSAILASPVALGGIAYTGLMTTALALWVESKAFARVPATDASLILTTEPLFAAGLGAITLGETFGMSDYAGASLIIGACVMATLIDDENRDDDCKPEDVSCETPHIFPFGSK